MTFLPLMNAHSALVPVPCVPEGIFSLLFAAKIERRSCDREERVFFPLITIAASPLNFRRKQQEKNPLAPRVSYQFSSLYNVYKEKPIFQNITKKHVHVIFPVLILFVQSTHMERIWVTGRDRVGRTCLENFACLWKYPATRLFSSTKEKHQPSFGLRHLCENRTT